MNICLKVVYEKSKAKICNCKFATFLSPFQASRHKNAPLSDISPLKQNKNRDQ